VRVMGFGGPDDIFVTSQLGTSFATPTAAGVAAVLKSGIPVLRWNPHRVRTCLALSAYHRNVDAQWRYSTPGKGHDFLDGAGGIDARLAYLWCGSSGNNDDVGVGVIHVILTEGEDPPSG